MKKLLNRVFGFLVGGALCVTVPVLATPAIATPAPHTADGFPVNGQGPVQTNIFAAAAYEIIHPGISPTGTNEPCTPAKGQRPVILIPGTSGSAYDSFAYLAPQLKAEGLCIYSFNHNPLAGSQTMFFTGDIRESAEQLAAVVDRVQAETGASQVDLVGWSQGGGPIPRYFIQHHPEKVHTSVGIVPAHNGTDFWLFHDYLQRFPERRPNVEAAFARSNAQALPQQLTGSDFYAQLYAGPVTPGVRYMNIGTQFDQVMLPYTRAFIHEPGVDNRLVQDYCPGRPTDHVDATYDPVVIALVLEGLSGVPRPIQC